MKTDPSELLENISKWSMNNTDNRVRKLYGQMTGRTELWIQAYANTYSNKGSMTPGVINNTVDNMSIERIKKHMNALKYRRYEPKPVRRTYISKENSNKKRPLGLPVYDDKLVQEVMRMQLTAVYEPVFKNCSHGFRPNRSCHTALKYIRNTFTGTKWFVEGDIKGCFDNINHQILVELIRKKVDDERYIELIRRFLDAGYMEDWRYHNTFSGTPQGGVLSPLLANIYLHELDKYMMKLAEEYYTERERNKKYTKIYNKVYWLRQKLKRNNTDSELKEKIKKIKREQQRMRSWKPPKRINYCRYADDFIVGILGTKTGAQNVKKLIAQFLKNKLKLELSLKKTHVTYCQDRAEFLSYEIKTTPVGRSKQRSDRGNIRLYMPEYKIRKMKNEFTNDGKARHLPQLLCYDDKEILLTYDSKLRGWYNYWMLAVNVCQLHEVYWFAKMSFFKTMANKYKTSAQKIIKKYYDKENKQIVVRLKVKNEDRTYKMINSFRKKKIPMENPRIDSMLNIYYFPDGVEIKRRILADKCEICGRKTKNLIGHHIRRMADVRNTDEYWKRVMKSKRRTSLMVCSDCNKRIHRHDWTNK